MMSFEHYYEKQPNAFNAFDEVCKFRARERRKSSLRVMQRVMGLFMVMLGIVCTVIEHFLAPGVEDPDLTLALIAGGLGAWLLFSKKTVIR